MTHDFKSKWRQRPVIAGGVKGDERTNRRYGKIRQRHRRPRRRESFKRAKKRLFRVPLGKVEGCLQRPVKAIVRGRFDNGSPLSRRKDSGPQAPAVKPENT